MMLRNAFIVAALVASHAALAQAQTSKVAERAALGRMKGAAEATVTVYEIADFQCPFCSKFAREVFPHIDSAYVKTGKIKWIYMNFPLPNHANSWVAAEAAMCAGGVGNQFWAMHDRLFANQSEWAPLANPTVVFAKYAKQIGVPAEAYAACTASDLPATIVIRDLLQAASAGVGGTPAFVVNAEPIFTGYRSFEDWRDMLDAALKKPAAAPTK